MASRDLAGLLTGISGTQRPNPNQGSDEWRMAFGAQQAQNLGNAVGDIGGMFSGKRSLNPQEAIQIGAGELAKQKKEQIVTQLIKAGRKDVADAYVNGTITEAQASSQILSGLAESRINPNIVTTLTDLGLNTVASDYNNNVIDGATAARAIASHREAKVAIAEGREGMTAYLSKMGLRGTPEMLEAQSGGYDNLTASQFNNVIDIAVKFNNPEIQGTNYSLYNTDAGKQMVGQFKIDQGAGRKQTVWGYVNPKGDVVPVDFNSISKVTDSKGKGINVSRNAIRDISVRLATAGSNAVDSNGEPLAGFLTDANDAWKALDGEAKYTVALSVATRAEQYRTRKDNPLNQLEAENKAIKEIFVDNIEKKGFTVDLEWGDTLLNMDKTNKEIAKGIVDTKLDPNGKFSVETSSGIPVIFGVKSDEVN